MPFPQPEAMRKAIEESVHAGLAATMGTWDACIGEDDGIEFRPSEDGTIEILYSDEDAAEDQPAEKNYKFRVRVEFVGVEDA